MLLLLLLRVTCVLHAAAAAIRARRGWAVAAAAGGVCLMAEAESTAGPKPRSASMRISNWRRWVDFSSAWCSSAKSAASSGTNGAAGA
eukprot:4628649-Pleurochrysis_carterae.AAC.2